MLASPVSDTTSHGSPEKLRETIAEWLWFMIQNAEIGILYAQCGDDHGLSYAIQRLTGYNRAIVPTLADLLEQHPAPPPARTAKTWTTTEEPRP